MILYWNTQFSIEKGFFQIFNAYLYSKFKVKRIKRGKNIWMIIAGFTSCAKLKLQTNLKWIKQIILLYFLTHLLGSVK